MAITIEEIQQALDRSRALIPHVKNLLEDGLPNTILTEDQSLTANKMYVDVAVDIRENIPTILWTFIVPTLGEMYDNLYVQKAVISMESSLDPDFKIEEQLQMAVTYILHKTQPQGDDTNGMV